MVCTLFSWWKRANFKVLVGNDVREPDDAQDFDLIIVELWLEGRGQGQNKFCHVTVPSKDRIARLHEDIPGLQPTVKALSFGFDGNALGALRHLRESYRDRLAVTERHWSMRPNKCNY